MTVEVPQHAALSPSSRHRWGACPGSIREEAKYPETRGGDAAVDGTHSHTLLEYVIKNDMWRLPIPATFVGFEMEDHDGKFVVQQDRIDRVNIALDYIRERAIAAGVSPISERRVHPDGLTGRADLSGTVDVQIPGKDVYEIIDYKDGMSPVTAENNPQMEQYAIGALAGLEKQPKSFQITVIQPKLVMRGMPAISTWNISTKGLLERVLPTIVEQAKATDDPSAPLVPGTDQCKYCKAKGACSALAGEVMSKVGMMFESITIPVIDPGTLDVASQAAQKDPTKMSDHELRQILEAAPLLRQLLDGVDKEVERRLTAGIPVPGFKLVRGRGSRGWALPEDQMEKKLTAMKIPKASLYPKKILSPSALEKLTWEKDGQTQKLSIEQLKRIDNEYVSKNTGKLTVAPESDPREAIITCAAPLFDAIPVQAEVVTPPWEASAPAAPALPSWLR